MTFVEYEEKPELLLGYCKTLFSTVRFILVFVTISLDLVCVSQTGIDTVFCL